MWIHCSLFQRNDFPLCETRPYNNQYSYFLLFQLKLMQQSKSTEESRYTHLGVRHVQDHQVVPDHQASLENLGAPAHPSLQLESGVLRDHQEDLVTEEMNVIRSHV